MSTVAFPIRVQFSDGEIELFESLRDAEFNLEWIDTEARDDAPVLVLDAQNRRVRLKIVALEALICELAPVSE